VQSYVILLFGYTRYSIIFGYTRKRQAIHCPVYKDGDKDTFSNYRPISVIPSFTKIYEKAVFNSLLSYLETNYILTQK